jgi:hypothetical protein
MANRWKPKVRDYDRADRSSQPRVSRDPCPRCGVRGDIGCSHGKVELRTVMGLERGD